MVKIGQKNDAALYPVTFVYNGTPGVQASLAGSFNDWEPEKNPMICKETAGVYSCDLLLPAGSYEYKLVVDGEWLTDQDNPNFSANDFGTLNSVINIG